MNKEFKEIFDKNYAPLCNYAAAIIKNKHAAEDLVQSVFIQLWEKKKFIEMDKPASYLMLCVKNKSIDYLRALKRNKETSMDELPEKLVHKIQHLKEEDIDPILSYFVSKLPPKTKNVFLLSRKQGLSYKEIANQLGVSSKTVENQMSSALKKMRILLKEHHYLPAILLFFQ